MSPESRDAWGWAIARCGDVIAPLSIAAACLIVSALLPGSDPAAWTWWIAGVVLLLLARRAWRKAVPPS